MSFARELGTWAIHVETNTVKSLPRLEDSLWHGVIANFNYAWVVDITRKLKVPVVGAGGFYGCYDPTSSIPYLVSDSEAVARLAAAHLLELGFRHYAFCGFSPTPMNGWSRDRELTFSSIIRGAGHTCATYNSAPPTTTTWNRNHRQLMDWLASLPRPLGLMACCDAQACQVLNACRALGLRVPEDVAVVGVDNDVSVCEFTDPPLTSVEQGGQRLGYEAAQLLEQMMSGKKVAGGKRTVEPVGVVSRRSTDSLAIDDPDVVAGLLFIRRHATEGIGISDVCSVVSMAPSSFRGQFKRLVGRTIHDEIQRVRIEHAKQLLISTDWPLKQVAKQSGFSSARYLATVMHSCTGLSPSDFRRRYFRSPG
jgi:LacI family transcriptional regulator